VAEPGCDVVVVGGAGTDYLARGATLPSPGHPARGEAFFEGPGGKGVNAALAAVRLGARAALIACVGDDEHGRGIRRQLAVEAVDVRHLRLDAGAATGVTLIHVDERGEKQTFAVPGANLCLRPEDVRAATPLIRGARVLVAQLEPPLETIAAAVETACAGGVRVILDPAPPRELPDDLLRAVDVVKPNASEAEALTGVRVHDRASARRAARALLARGAGAAAVEDGREGTLLLAPNAEHWLPRLEVASVDSTGAGDAFAAALAVALAEGRTLAEAGSFATAAAALATTRIGAYPSLPTRAAVLALLAAQSDLHALG
jgi:ribokinase